MRRTGIVGLLALLLLLAAGLVAAASPPSCDVNPNPKRCRQEPPPPPPPPPGTWSCVHIGNGGCPETLGPNGETGYLYPQITNSNGWNTYVNNDCWANPGCDYRLEANSPGDWQTTATEPALNESVRTFPDVQQLFNNWCPTSPGWGACGTIQTYTPIAGLTQLTATYAETMPSESTGTFAQFAWDFWTGDGQEVMVWVDNRNRDSGGATFLEEAVIAGQTWSLYRFGADLYFWSLGGQGSFAQQSSGTVDLLALLRAFQARGILSAGETISQVNGGFEICSTGGVPQTFRVTDYTLTGAA